MGVAQIKSRQRNSEDKQQRLLNAALELFVEQGLEGASTANIAKRAGVANGTLFHHFSNKKMLITQLYLKVKQDVADAMTARRIVDSGYREVLFQQWLGFMRWCVDHPNQLRFILQYSHSADIAKETRQQALFGIFSFVVEYLHYGQKKGFIIHIEDALLMDMVESMVLGAASHFLHHPDKLTEASYQQQAFNLLWHGLATDRFRLAADRDATQN